MPKEPLDNWNLHLVERRKGAEPGSRPEIVASAQVRQIDDVLAAIASGDLIELDHPWVV
jgi:hypothetical protein